MYMQSSLGPANQQWKHRCLAKLLVVEVVCVLLVPVSRAQDALSQPDAMICRPRLKTADGTAATASRQQHQSQAICSLQILGHGRPIPGIKSIKLSCHNPSEPGAKVLVGLPSSTLGSPFHSNKVTSAVVQQLKQLAAPGQGIQLAPPGSQLCQTAAETTIAQSDTVSLYGLLYFCQGNIRFVQPVVRDVWLPYAVGGRVQEDTAILVVAGSASAVFEEATISRNDASSAIAVLGTGDVEILNSTFEGNHGNPGSGLFVRDNATLRVEHSTFRDNFSSDYGGAMAIMGCAAVSIHNTHITNNTARRSGGGLYVIEQAAVTITKSTVEGNQADRGGGIAARSHVTLGRATWVINNSATMDGGGILIEGPLEPQPTSPELQVAPDAHITRNTAQGGAGVSIGQGVNFNSQAVREAVVGNRATDYDHDISVMPETLTLLNQSAAGLVDFVGRPVDDKGLLQVRLRLAGAFGFPCGGQQINAYWKDAVSLQQPAGRPPGSDDAPASSAGSRRRLQQGPAAAAGASGWVAGSIAELPSAAAGLAGTLEAAAATASPGAAAQPSSTGTSTALAAGAGIPAAGLPPGPLAGPRQGFSDWPGLEEINERTVPRMVAVTGPDGVVVFSLKFVQPPGLHNITFRLSPVSAQFMLGDFPTARLTVRVRPCITGEREVRPGVCEVCLEGSYSFTNSSAKCLECPSGADCPGGHQVISQQGFWQSSLLSDQMHRCPNPAACAGDRSLLRAPCSSSSSSSGASTASDCQQPATSLSIPELMNMQCSSNAYEGHLCGRCAAGHGALRPFQCVACMDRPAAIAVYVTGALLVLCFLKLMCHFTLKDSQRQAAAADGAAGSLKATNLLRHLVLHVQYLLIIASVQVGATWPASVSAPIKAVAVVWSPATPETLAPECLLQGTTFVQPAVSKVLFYLLMPVAMITALLLLEVILLKLLPRRPAQGSIPDRLLSCGIVVTFFFLPSIARTAFSLFACVSVDQPAVPPYSPKALGWFWIHDTNQACLAGWHRTLALFLGIPVGLFICLVPVGILVLMLHPRSRLDDPRFVRHYYFLLQDYKPKHRYWEAVVSIQTIGLVAVSVFCFTLGPYYQALALNVLLAAFALLLVVVQPLAHKQAMNVALASLLCLFLTSYTALTFAQHGSFIAAGSSHQITAELLAIPMYMGVVVVVFNFVYIAWVLWQLFHLIRWRQALENAKKAYAQVLACSCCDSEQSEMTSQRRRHRAPPEAVTVPREVIPGVGVFDAVTIMGSDQELGQFGRHRKQQQQQHLGGHLGAESA